MLVCWLVSYVRLMRLTQIQFFRIDYFVVGIYAFRIIDLRCFYCPNLIKMHAKRRYHALTQGIITINDYPSKDSPSAKCYH